MNVSSDHSTAAGVRMHDMIARLFPICRSQTGDGVRESLRMLQELIPLQLLEVPSGTPAFDWEVPQEWNIREAWIADESGRRVIDIRESTLHVINGSIPIHRRLPWSELQEHLQTLPDQPDLIPYRTAFFQNKWGFCLSQQQFDELSQRGDQTYEVCIDADLTAGSLTLGEWYLPGESEAEVLLSTHTCHPSLANDGLSGLVVAVWLARWLATQPRRYSWRLLLAPATIGAITWLSLNRNQTDRIRHGLVLSCLGDTGPLNYHRSRRGDAEIDRQVASILQTDSDAHQIHDFEPFGYDQRQFCSPGFDLPVGCLMRTPNGQYPEYHTSADDLSLVKPEALEHSLNTLIRICESLEAGYTPAFVNRSPHGEPRLGKHGLYHAFGSRSDAQQLQTAMLWILNLSDGRHSLADIAYRSGLTDSLLEQAASLLESHHLLTREDFRPRRPLRQHELLTALTSI